MSVKLPITSTPAQQPGSPPTDPPPTPPAGQIAGQILVTPPPVVKATRFRAKHMAITAAFKHFFRAIARVFKSSDDFTTTSSSMEEISNLVKGKRPQARPLDLWPGKPVTPTPPPLRDRDLIPSAPAKIKTPEEIHQGRITNRLDTRTKLQVFAKKMAAAAAASEGVVAFDQRPLGQVNIGNSCYMNSALQCLESAYLPFDQDLQGLITSDLTLPEGGSLAELERDKLYKWAPIKDFASLDVDALKRQADAIVIPTTTVEGEEALYARRLLGEQKVRLNREHFEANKLRELPKNLAEARTEYDTALSEFSALGLLEKTPRTDDEKRAYARLNQAVKRISYLQLDRLAREDRILFKWSYLLLLQAKKFGKPNEIREALILHRNTSFGIERDLDLRYEALTAQHDPNAYFVMWHDMLGVTSDQVLYQQANLEGSTLLHGDFTYSSGHILSLGNLKDAFLDNVKDYFDESLRPTKEKEDIAKKIADKKAELESIGLLNVVARHNLDRDIKALEGYLTRLDTQDNSWRAPGRDPIENYDNHKRYIDAPPEVINIQTKRWDQQGRKITKDYPFDASNGSYTAPLDLTPYFKPELLQGHKAEYDLTAINVHLGGSDPASGHYKAYVRRGDKWYEANDSTVTPITVDKVPFKQAYFLSYRKREAG